MINCIDTVIMMTPTISAISILVCNCNKEISGFIYIALACYELSRCHDVYHITHHYSLDCNSHCNPLGSGGVQQTL